MVLFSLFISGAEMAFTLFIILLVFGADTIPDIAKGLAKIIRVVREASNTMKTEIKKTAEKQGLNTNLSGKMQNEMNKIKEEFEGITGNFKRNF